MYQLNKVITEYNNLTNFIEVKKVILDNGEEWNLEGECNRCGDCCLYLKMPIDELADKDRLCTKLEWEELDSNPVSKCNIHWTKPSFCQLYPINPNEPLYEHCSYKWIRSN